MNVPRIPQQELESADKVGQAIVSMKLAINPATVTDRILQLGEADSISFGAVTVIAIGDRVVAPAIDATPADIHKEHVVDVVKAIEVEPNAPIDRSPVRPLTTERIERSKAK